MTACRICRVGLGPPDYASPAPALTSLTTRLDVPTEVLVCRACGHVQSPDLPNLRAFYDHDYRISLQSDDDDQLYAIEDGREVFRTEHQARLVEDVGLEDGARVLDFGAAKATTLQKLLCSRPDLKPYVFDVSEDYRGHWKSWLPAHAQATYELPEAWAGQFDLITAHFVLEHVDDPVSVVQSLTRCLAPEGRLFFTVPDPIGNPGDLLVADHLNHFVPSSIHRLLAKADLNALLIRQDLFRGAYVVLAARGGAEASSTTEVGPVLELLSEWRAMINGVKEQVRAAGDGSVAIYGAGFYGALFYGSVADRAICFLDQNPHLQGRTLDGLPVLAPEECPNVTVVVAALNPIHAHTILTPDAEWLPTGVTIVYPGSSLRRSVI
jgi:SAM-dependent methyltransferase